MELSTFPDTARGAGWKRSWEKSAGSITPAINGCLVKLVRPMFTDVSLLDHLAARVRALRQRHGLTQEEFAEIAGFSYKFYQQIEAGRKKQVWLETVERLSASFGLEVWQMLAPEEPGRTIVTGPAKKHLAVGESASRYLTKPARRSGRPKKRR